ncbi:hypothetical protein HPB52_005184 [Rhipicephalus sanguineus]|uniref:Protein kinase domain-containing protein n=1 Tax=Rhipicephalus sanguineus TaxID=34632 RepID=A0A9D4PYM6_RHISA|nr:hypothetical protein HPB52_005184 [Rhipicephalus sanguineus]
MVVLCLVYSRPVRPDSRPRRLRHCHFVVSDEEDATGKVVVRTRALSHESCANHSPHWCSPATVVDLGRRSGAGNHHTLDAAEDRCGEQEWRFSSVGHEVLTVSPLMDQPFLFSSGDHGTLASASQLQPALPSAAPPPPRSPTLAVTGLLKVVHWLSQRRKSARPDAGKQHGRSRLADERLARKKLKVLSSHQPAAATPPCTCHTRKASFAAGILSPNGSLSSSGYISSSASSAVQTPSDTELDCRGARAHEPCRLHPTRGAGLVRQNAVISEHGRSGRQWLANKARTLSLETKANDVEKLCATWPPLGRSAGNPAENFLEEPESGIEESEQEDKSKNQSTNIKDTLGEWCVPYKDVEFKERLRQGRDTDVYRGRWHGEVLIYTFRHTKEQDVTRFWDEVGKLSMIRHENIALFMGACAEPPQYAIITSMKKGPSLFEHIHIKKHHLSFHTKVNIARQIVQGMGYLHAKGIVHKSLTSKNVVLESRVKLCLMDQGLAERVHDPSDRGCLARGHLTYLAPELMRQLKVEPPNVFSDCEPSQESDLYAFG